MVSPWQQILDLEDRIDASLERPRMQESFSEKQRSDIKDWSELVYSKARYEGLWPLSGDTIAAGKDLFQRPVFIGGVPRSGTTLTVNLLDSHPELAVLPFETSYINFLKPRLSDKSEEEQKIILVQEILRRLIDFLGQEPYFLLGRSHTEGSPYVDFVRMLLAWWDQTKQLFPEHRFQPFGSLALAYATFLHGGKITPGVNYWVDKSPLCERHYYELMQAFPKAKWIQLIRHPYDVYASRKKVEMRIAKRFNSRINALIELKDSYKIALRLIKQKEHCLILTYEALVENQEQSLTAIGALLKVHIDPVSCQQTIAGRPCYANSSFVVDRSCNRAAPITAIRELSYEEKETVSAVVGPYSRKLGYDIREPLLLKRVGVILILFFWRVRCKAKTTFFKLST